MELFSTNTLHNILRPSNLERAALGLKIIFIVLSLALIALVLFEILFTSSPLETDGGLSTKPVIDLTQVKDNNAAATGEDYSDIVRLSIFGKLEQTKEPKTPDKPVTKLQLELIGTFISPGSAPYAIIQEKNQQDAFRIDEEIFDKATLVEIYSDRVEIRHNGKIELLTLEDDAGKGASVDAKAQGGVVKVDENQYVVDEDELDKALDNLPVLLQQARAVPYFKDGKSVGLRLFAIKSGSLFQKLGFRNGDILKSINGNSLADPSQALKLFEDLKSERSISVVSERARKESEIKYEIR